MLAFIEGLLDDLTADSCVIDAGGMGYNINISERTVNSLSHIGDHVKLYTHMSVREDAISLYGFLTRDELNMFRKLISIGGIGPKGALGILSVFDPDGLRFAIMNGDAKGISKAPGIGAKTAQRVILELKDKVSLSEDSLIREYRLAGEVNSGLEQTQDTQDTPDISDAISALVSLGYSATEARKAVYSIENRASLDSGSILSAALKILY